MNNQIIQKFLDLIKRSRNRIISLIKQISFTSPSVNLGIMNTINQIRISQMVQIYKIVLNIPSDKQLYNFMRQVHVLDKKYQMLTSLMLVTSNILLKNLMIDVLRDIISDLFLKSLKVIVYNVINQLQNHSIINANKYSNIILIKNYLVKGISETLITKSTNQLVQNIGCYVVYQKMDKLYDKSINVQNDLIQEGFKIFVDLLSCDSGLKEFKYSFYSVWKHIALLIEEEILSF